MPIFQKSVLQKHLHNLNKEKVEKAFQIFQSNYNSAKIAQIKTLKEEEYQDGFLRDVFVDVLGYTLRPEENYNLQREFKNQTDGKKADAAILTTSGQVPLSVATAIAVIELKSTKTKDLTKVTQQAFNYKNNQPECKYVITSNFQKLRFYINYANEYEEFDLFTLQKKDFEVLYLLLNKNSIFENLPLKIKEETKFHEQEISNKLYKDYSRFKRKLYENLIKNHPESNKLTLFKKSQKLVDRFLFILFAEDSGLLPPNSITSIIETYYKLIELDAKKPLYDIFKQYFGYMNIGRKGKTNAGNIPAYNGGLFYKDALLDSLKIEDTILIEDLRNLSEYDFNTEVDVNILGHIFEHSLNEIEEVYNTTKGDVPLSVNKRKKDGVFYTPKYITQYIVENTIGALCNEKRIALEIEEIEFDSTFRTKKETLSEKGKKLYNKLKTYKEWLISLKIIDPACGSGAFLNQALNFLIEEHTSIDDIIEDLTNSSLSLRLFDIDKTILENNLFGVDINEESIEIAQLSLWLRTAQKGRKLSNLNNNIKCGNSLIDDPKIAGENAFNWNTEFKEIMDNGGFDVVIGNPPYFNIQTLGAKSKIAQSIQNSYPEIWQDKSDILFYFIAKAIEISKNSIGFIVSNAFMFSDKAKKLRKYILENAPIEKIINFEKYMVFQDASITTNIIKLNKNKKDTTCLAYVLKEKNYTQEFVSQTINNIDNYFKVNLKKDKVFALVETKIANLNEKIDSNNEKLNQLFKIGKGMETAADKIFKFNEYTKQFPKEFIKTRVTGKNVTQYHISNINEYILYFEEVENFEDLPQPIQNHLLENKAFLENRATVKNEGRIWWRYSRPMHKEYYHLDKIFCSRRAFNNTFAMDSSKDYLAFSNMSTIFDTNKDLDIKYLLGLLNSNVLNFRYKSIGKQTGGGSYEFFPNGIGKLPIPHISKAQQLPIIQLVDSITDNKQKQADYTNLLTKAKTENKFDREIQLGKELKQITKNIASINAEIDTMVYKLYGLRNEEIKIIENS